MQSSASRDVQWGKKWRKAYRLTWRYETHSLSWSELSHKLVLSLADCWMWLRAVWWVQGRGGSCTWCSGLAAASRRRRTRWRRRGYGRWIVSSCVSYLWQRQRNYNTVYRRSADIMLQNILSSSKEEALHSQPKLSVISHPSHSLYISYQSVLLYNMYNV